MTALLALLLGLALQTPASPAPLSRADDLPTLRPGDVVAGRIEDGDPVVETDVLRKSYTDAPAVARAFRVEVTEAGPCHVELRSDFFDAYLVLRDEQGKVLAEDDDGLVGTQSQIAFDARPGAALRVEACALHGGKGAFEVSLRLGAPAVLDPQQRLRAGIEDLRRSVDARTQELGPEHLDVAAMLNNLALLLRTQGDYAAARPLYERSLAIREKALGPEHPRVASSLNSLATVLQAQGDYAAARGLFERSLAIRERTLGPEHPDLAQSVNNLALLLQAQGDYAEARPLFERSLAIYEQALGAGHEDVARSRNNLARLLQAQGDYAGARLLFERSLATREQVLGPEHPDVAQSVNNLATLLLGQGDSAGALPLFERSLAIYEKALGPEHPDVATSLNNLANLLLARGDYAAARPLLERSLAIYEKALGSGHPDVALSLNNLAHLLEAQGAYAEARPLYERSLAIVEKTLGTEHPNSAITRGNLAAVLQAQGDHAGARPILEQALATFESALGPEHPYVTRTLNLLGMLLADLGQSEAATKLLARGDTSRRLSLAHFMQRASEAEACDYLATLRWQMDLVQSPSTFVGPATAACESLLWWKGQALRAARTGRSVLRDRIGGAGRDLADRLHDVVAALSRTSSDIARSGEPMDRQGLADLVDERGRLERQLYALTTGLPPEVPSCSRLRDALPDRAALVDLLVHRVYQPARAGGADVVAKGRWSEPRITAWIIRRDADEPVRVDLGAATAIESAIRALLDALVGSRGVSLAGGEDPSVVLRRLVWDPLAPHLGGIDTVIVSPDGVLGTLPFEILRSDDGRYLVEDRGFVYLTDPTELVRMSPGPVAPDGALLAIGGVDHRSAADVQVKPDASPPPVEPSSVAPVVASAAPSVSDALPRGGWTDIWRPLDSTLAEVQSVAARHEAAFPDSRRFVLTGPAASEEQFKALLPTYAVLHLATHGYFNPEGLPSLGAAAQREVDRRRDSAGLPEESFTDVARRLQGYSPGLLCGLVCAGVNGGLPGARDDGYLTAEEVGWLDLSGVELVVLSACDTGLGRPQSGEGLIGLRRAFLMAGGKTVISSLWSVPDQETADLMDLFYRNLWQKRLGRHAALRAAQLELIARNRARYAGDARPVTWGAFVLDGDWR